MPTIHQVYLNVSKLNLETEVLNTLNATSVDLIKAQIKQRLEEGKDGKGKRLAPYKSATYRELKIEAGHNDVTDLTLTGDLNRAMFVDTYGDEFLIGSDDGKLSKLESKYGNAILEIAPDYLAGYTEKSFFPKLKDRIEKVTKLEMV